MKDEGVYTLFQIREWIAHIESEYDIITNINIVNKFIKKNRNDINMNNLLYINMVLDSWNERLFFEQIIKHDL